MLRTTLEPPLAVDEVELLHGQVPVRSTAASASTALFVPGHRADRFSKVAASGAGFVIIDLEDAVGADHKDTARDAASIALTDPASGVRAAVRVNGLADGGDADIASLARVVEADASRLLGVVVPKAEDAAAIGGVAA